MTLQERISQEFPNVRIKVTGPDRESLNVIDMNYRGARVIIAWEGGPPFQTATALPGVGVQQALDENPGPRLDTEDDVLAILRRTFGGVDVAREDGLLKAVATLLTEDED